FQAEAGIRDRNVTGVQTCALPISDLRSCRPAAGNAASHRWSDLSVLRLLHPIDISNHVRQTGLRIALDKVPAPALPLGCGNRGRSEERRVGKEWSRQRARQRSQKM